MRVCAGVHARASKQAHANKRTDTHLARVRVDDEHVALALGAHQHDLLHVLALYSEVVLAEILSADLVEEFHHSTQQLLRDALARADVDVKDVY